MSMDYRAILNRSRSLATNKYRRALGLDLTRAERVARGAKLARFLGHPITLAGLGLAAAYPLIRGAKKRSGGRGGMAGLRGLGQESHARWRRLLGGRRKRGR